MAAFSEAAAVSDGSVFSSTRMQVMIFVVLAMARTSCSFFPNKIRPESPSIRTADWAYSCISSAFADIGAASSNSIKIIKLRITVILFFTAHTSHLFFRMHTASGMLQCVFFFSFYAHQIRSTHNSAQNGRSDSVHLRAYHKNLPERSPSPESPGEAVPSAPLCSVHSV